MDVAMVLTVFFLIEVRTDTMKCTNKRIADKSIEIRTDE